MTDDFSQQLHQIITLSQTLLNELGNVFEQLNEKDGENKVDNNKKIALCNDERNTLIKLVFNEKQSKNYSLHITLINKIILLDNQLIQQASQNKLALKTSLLKMKKNQKAANTYKKY